MNYVTATIQVFGYVQGIGYRYFVQKLALSYNLTGYAKNNSDGSVEIELELDESLVDEFIQKLKTDHHWAKVNKIETKISAYKNIYKEFIIK
jgi:acylphosphatase